MISYKNKTVQMSVSKIYGRKRILPITYCNIRTISIVAYFYMMLQIAKNYNLLNISSVNVRDFEMAHKFSRNFADTLNF